MWLTLLLAGVPMTGMDGWCFALDVLSPCSIMSFSVWRLPIVPAPGISVLLCGPIAQSLRKVPFSVASALKPDALICAASLDKVASRMLDKSSIRAIHAAE